MPFACVRQPHARVHSHAKACVCLAPLPLRCHLLRWLRQGAELSLADATVFPTLVFVAHMLPLFQEDGKLDMAAALGDKLARWYQQMRDDEAVFSRVHAEIQGALDGWSAGGRWDAILHAGEEEARWCGAQVGGLRVWRMVAV